MHLIVLLRDVSLLVYINEVGNEVAAKAVAIALNYVKKNPGLGLSVDMIQVEGNRSDSKGMLESSEYQLQWQLIFSHSWRRSFSIPSRNPVCMTYSRQLITNKPPHVILDTTLSGLASETVKSLSSALGIPTISGSFGQEVIITNTDFIFHSIIFLFNRATWGNGAIFPRRSATICYRSWIQPILYLK